MVEWEYLAQVIRLAAPPGAQPGTVFPSLGDALNEFGSEGWEVVALWRSTRKTTQCRVVFKRPKT